MAMLLKADGTKEPIPEELTLSYMQWLVGGDIEMVALVPLTEGATLIVDEDGLNKGKPVNTEATRLYRIYGRDPAGILVGDVIQCVVKNMGRGNGALRMTRARIAEGLNLLVLMLANAVPVMETPPGWEPHEWAYVKGLASSEVLRLAKLVGAE